MIACDWDGEAADSPQTLAVIVAVDVATPPNTSWNLAAIGDSATTEPETLATAQVFTSPPSGTTTLSGTVQTLDEVPVVGACIFILASPSAVFQAISDDDGNWSLGALPDGYQFVIATVAPFEGEFGPCTNDGPPPAPGPDDLQPVFFDNVWFDLGDPELVGGQSDPYAYAIEHGATSVSGTTSGLDACLTTALRDAIPRPSCAIVVATTTTTSTTTTTTEPASTTTVGPTTTADPGTTTTTAVGGITSVPRPPTTVLLPVTGTSTDGVGVIAALILGIGVAALVATRRPRRAGRP
ncbi:MAG: hypothetical protein H0U21_07220 [Acidimicrobiia bacterium]|nr:hypothetical protein [Acidimicrobiia bacterium]